MSSLFADSQLDSVLARTKDVLGQVSETFFNARSMIALIIALASAIILGRIIAAVMRRVARVLSAQADKTPDLKRVNLLRRFETLIILTVALVRMLLVIIALYFWWVYIHPNQQPTALIGASAIFVVMASAMLGPVLRDLAYGGVMMAEHWFGVGDYVKIEPFDKLQGIVERVTLRSTKVRGLNGEIIWINNQNIQAVRITPKGVRTIAIELFVSNLKRGLKLVEDTNLRLPNSPLMVARPLHILGQTEVGPALWHIVAIGETAPGREWLLEEYALRIMQELDEDSRHPVLEIDPIARSADQEADQRFARTIQNARKSPLQRRGLPLPETITETLSRHHLTGRRPIQRKPTKSVRRVKIQ